MSVFHKVIVDKRLRSKFVKQEVRYVCYKTLIQDSFMDSIYKSCYSWRFVLFYKKRGFWTKRRNRCILQGKARWVLRRFRCSRMVVKAAVFNEGWTGVRRATW